MDTRHQLLAFVVLTHFLTTGMWWAAGSWMGLSRRAARQWLISSLVTGIGLVVLTLPPLPVALLRELIAGNLFVIGAVTLRRGLQSFLKLPHTDTSHWVLGGGLAAFTLLLCVPLGWQYAAGIVSCLTFTAIQVRLMQESFLPIKNEFNAATSWVNVALRVVSIAIFLVVGVLSIGPEHLRTSLDEGSGVYDFTVVFSSVALSILSAFVMGYIVVMRLVRRLEHLSHHDALTGLLNRRAIEYLLDREDQRLQRFGDPYSVILADIDHFKRINDRLGHAAGDAVLCAVARTLQSKAREVDRVARYGGEEFCILLPHTLHEGAQQAAERLREAIHLINVPWNDEVITVTISAGVACANAPGEPLRALMSRSDEALYQAKAEGRNRVVMSADRPRRPKTA